MEPTNIILVAIVVFIAVGAIRALRMVERVLAKKEAYMDKAIERQEIENEDARLKLKRLKDGWEQSD